MKVKKRFAKQEKEAIVAKSGGRCAHCGKFLSTKLIGDFVPVELPFNTSEIVGLCKECYSSIDTQEGDSGKTDDVSRIDYYRYLNFKYLEDGFKSPLMNVMLKGLYPEEEFSFESEYLVREGIKNSKGKVIQKPVTLKTSTRFQKARYSDLNELLEFYNEYISAFDIDCDAKNYLSFCFTLGVIYFSRSKNNKISMVIMVEPPFGILSKQSLSSYPYHVRFLLSKDVTFSSEKMFYLTDVVGKIIKNLFRNVGEKSCCFPNVYECHIEDERLVYTLKKYNTIKDLSSFLKEGKMFERSRQGGLYKIYRVEPNQSALDYLEVQSEQWFQKENEEVYVSNGKEFIESFFSGIDFMSSLLNHSIEL